MSGARRVGVLALALAASVGLVLAAEGALRLFGVADPGHGASRLRYQQVYPPLLRPDALPDGRAVLATVDPRLPYQWVAPERPANSVRIVAVGGSATAGLGHSPNVTFARELEELLREALPGFELDVLNLGIVALASGQVRTIVEDAVRSTRPDVVLVYSGNNEFLELHSLEFARLTGNAPSPVASALASSRILRLVRGGRREPSREELEASVTTRRLSRDDNRVASTEMLERVRLTDAQVRRLEERYAENLRAMVAAAGDVGAACVLMPVAVNEAWLGSEDEPDDWLVELVGAAPADDAGWEAVLEPLRAAREAAEPHAAYRWHHREARVLERLGRLDEASLAYRAALDADPHLRRATSRLAEHVRAVAAESGAPLVDAVAALRAASDDGTIGFEHFYDYVHFTPRGASTLAAAIYAGLLEARLVPEVAPFDADAWLARRLARLDGLERDFLDVGAFLGVGFEPARLASRDLWKYDTTQDELDARIAADPTDRVARAFRGNVRLFQVGRAGQAAADYEASLAVEEDPVVRANLARLRTDRRP